MKKITGIHYITISIAILLAFGCEEIQTTAAEESLEGEEPYIIGEITNSRVNQYEHLEILVEEEPEVDEPSDPGGLKIWLELIDDQSEIFVKKESDKTIRSTFDNLECGQKVKAWTTDWVRLSHPAQGTAGRVIIIEE
ncbi:MAG: DUF3221 domain-containing protein [Balneolaceae bacterium]|nr:DUF3221 domain-containing protein [Balneolaceae bacterium]